MHYWPLTEWEPEQFQALARTIRALETRYDLSGNRAFYLALPPQMFPTTITGLGQAGLNQSSGWTRLVIEKPFGRDLISAQRLNRLAHHHFDETQIYRIDHYLGKETVQNILVFRFANPIFETLWNRDRVQSVQITVAENLGIEKRAGYYEQAGALRDMVQNHLTQLMTLMAMEIPSSFNPEAIRDEKVKVLDSIVPISVDDAVFGQLPTVQVFRATCKSLGLIQNRGSRLLSPYGWGSRTGDGKVCRSICAPANACHIVRPGS